MFTYYDLTDRFPTKIDLKRLQDEVRTLDGKNWISHYDVNLADGWTTIPLVSHDGTFDQVDSQRLGTWGAYKRTPYLDELPYFRELLDAFQCPHGRIRIMKLLPGTEIRTHRDTFDEVSDYAFGQVRLHIPIFTNDKVIFTVGGKNYHLAEGRLHYVNFSKPHYVRNDGDATRVHLVLDLKVNDFLAAVFPELSWWQKLECAVTRATYPLLVWAPLRYRTQIYDSLWRTYDGSFVQRLRHRYFPKSA